MVLRVLKDRYKGVLYTEKKLKDFINLFPLLVDDRAGQDQLPDLEKNRKIFFFKNLKYWWFLAHDQKRVHYGDPHHGRSLIKKFRKCNFTREENFIIWNIIFFGGGVVSQNGRK